MPRQRVPIEVRFWAKVQKADGCWNWLGQTYLGYGRICLGGGKGPTTGAHRFSYELHKGPIPEGLQIDHLCRNRACVNPDHLEAVTIAENVLRGEGITAQRARSDSCPNGHKWTPENTVVRSRGDRYCRICELQSQRRRYAERREKTGFGAFPKARAVLEMRP